MATEFDDFEVIAVDDGSTDATPQVLDRYASRAQGPPVRVVRNDRNLGVSGARNAGIAAARGQIVAFTDSDCRVDPRWLGALSACFDHPNVALAGGLVQDAPPQGYGELVYRGTARIGARGQGRLMVGCNMAIRRSLLANNPFDPALSYYCDEDDLARRLTYQGFIGRVARDARVTHEHRMSFAGLCRLGYLHGQGSARLWFKHDLGVGRDLAPWPVAFGLLAVAPFVPGARAGAGGAFGLLIAAQVVNEVHFKGRSWRQLPLVLPGALIQSACKLVGAGATCLRIAIGNEPAIVASKRRWKQRKRARR